MFHASSTLRLQSKTLDDSDSSYNERPIIGIVTQPTSSYSGYTSFMMAAYVKFIEMAGARVMPIMYDESDTVTTTKLSQINGVLFPGGATDLINSDLTYTDYMKKGETILNYIKNANDDGTTYPLLAIWLGFEELAILEVSHKLIRSSFDSDDVSLNLTFVEDTSNSKMYSEFSSSMISDLEDYSLTYNHHNLGITRTTFNKYSALYDYYTVTTISYDNNGKEFISSMEHKTYPFFGLQWHPEKNIFIWKSSLNIPHSKKAIKVAQAVSNFFVDLARENMNSYSDDAEVSLIIENYKTKFTSGLNQDIYLFST